MTGASPFCFELALVFARLLAGLRVLAFAFGRLRAEGFDCAEALVERLAVLLGFAFAFVFGLDPLDDWLLFLRALCEEDLLWAIPLPHFNRGLPPG